MTLTVMLGTGACGSNPPLIQHRLDMTHVATAPVSERDAVAEASRALYRAQVELEYAEFLVKDIDYEIREAEAEKKKLEAQSEIDKLEQQRNEWQFRGKLADAARSALGKDKGRKESHQKRMKYLRARKRALEKRVADARAQYDLRDAEFELAKARLAEKQGTAPKNVKVASFEKQVQRAKNRATNTASKRNSAEQKSKSLESEWKKAAQ